jgi:PAS domain S-box-containing protein
LNQNTLDSVSVQIAVVDTTGRVMAVNQPWRKFVSKTYEDCDAVIAIGSNFRTLFPDEKGNDDANLQTLWSGIQSVLDGSTTTYTEESPLRSTQPSPWFHTNVTLLGSGGLGVVISRTDITVVKLAGEQIRKLSRIAEQAPLSIVITDLDGAIEYTNPYFSEKTLYTAQEALGKNPSILRSGLTGSEVYQSLWQTLRKQQVWRGELHNRKKNGDFFVEYAIIAPVLDSGGVVTHYVALKEDITEAKQVEENRLELSQRIEEISRHLVRTQEETRQRFSQELHDRTSPNLAALGINLSIITRTIQKAPKSHEFDQNFADRIEDTRALIDDTNASIREICAGLHPAAIERAGLMSVVQSYAHQFFKRTAIQVRVDCPHDEIRLHADLELTLFRIVQEALTNCAKHAHAQTVDVRMQLDRRPVLLCVSDDGCGFELQPSTGRAPFHGLGLINMRETVEFAGGSFKLESAPGFGTRIYVEI